MSDVVLVQPPLHDFYLTAKRTIPYGLLCLASHLRQAGFRVSLIDGLATRKKRALPIPSDFEFLAPYYPQVDQSPWALFHTYQHFGYQFDFIAQQVRHQKPFLVGVSSLFTPYADQALQTVRKIKAVYPDCLVVVGGHHATQLPRQVLQESAVDFVIRGAGEASMVALAQEIRKPSSNFEHIPGLVSRGTLERGTLPPPAPWKPTWAQAGPSLDLLNQCFYRRYGHGSAVLVTSRGCPFTCTYCAVGRGNEPYQRRPEASVLMELKTAIEDHGARFIDFEDENLSLDRSWFLALLEAIIERWSGLGLELRAMNGLYPPSLDATLVQAMARAGFKTLNLSLGATDPERLARMGRNDVLAAFDDCLAWARAAKMSAVGYIIGAGPHQLAQDTLADLIYLARRRVLAGLSIYYPAPGSRDYEACRKLGVLPLSTALMRSSTFPVTHTTSRLEAFTLLKLARMINAIKFMADQGQSLPTARPYRVGAGFQDTTHRREIGRRLLSWFRHDGQLRGVSNAGQVFRLPTEVALTRKFRRFLDTEAIRGIHTP